MRTQQHRIELRQLTEVEGGGWLATFPDLPGCMSDGETPEKAMQNARQAEISWLAASEKWTIMNVKPDENCKREYWQRNADKITKIAAF
ncbi:MAG: type II toxin-antitoxin system HicB family antitoxin [Desulfovibrionaceae bacterium]|nr:type II toxin-antitoxin system HicB family antitoxin [Desulfovibrionaceae bacterium]